MVLREVAHAVAQQLRHTVAFGRYGGEAFVVLLPSTDQDQAMTIGARLLNTVRALQIVAERRTVQVMISLGLALRCPADESIEPLIDRADRALYRAKKEGRNHLVVET